MATLILSTVGSAIGGPIGGLIGSFLGAAVDRRIFGGNGRRTGPRVTDLAVQSAAYGEPIPRLYGRLRVAGNIIWSPGIRETTVPSGSGKRSGGTSSYTYSASFAVALAARQIHDVGRIWADGKLLRNADGSYVFPAVLRTYLGREDQLPDSSIVAIEGIANAPAYRGLTYIVFEDLQLADYANRIPNLTFELIADLADPDVGSIADDLIQSVGINPPIIEGDFPTVRGFAALRAGALLNQLEVLVPLADMSFADDGTTIIVRSGAADSLQALDENDLGTVPIGTPNPARQEDERSAAATLPDALSIGFFDSGRDYQLGLQRAIRRSPVVRAEQRDLPVVLDAVAAKKLAERLIGEAVAARNTAELRLPWRYAGIGVGSRVFAGTDPKSWRVRSRMMEQMVLKLSVERIPNTARHMPTADAGRSMIVNDSANGTTIIEVLDIPPLPGVLPVVPRVYLAVAGASDGWRQADIEISMDHGESYSKIARAAAAVPMGVADTALANGVYGRWDRHSALEVTLANSAMWLESRSEAAVLAGANLALVGDELLQFARVEAIAPCRFRLNDLLRGQRGTEATISGHQSGERFVMIDPERLIAVDLPFETLSSTVQFRASSRGMVDVDSVAAIRLQGCALRPLSPIGLRLAETGDGGVKFSWTRRSRAGFGWLDGVDAPLAEEAEAYRVRIMNGPTALRTTDVTSPFWTYPKADRAADRAQQTATMRIEIAQLSASLGAGSWASLAI